MTDKETGTVYAIRNLANGRVYVGSSKHPLAVRRNHHLCCLRQGKHRNRDLQADFNAIGGAGFEFIELERCDVRHLVAVERALCSYFRSLPAGTYNLVLPGDSGRTGHRSKWSAETRAKHEAIRAATPRGPATNETRAKMSQRKRIPVESRCPATGEVRQYESALHAAAAIDGDGSAIAKACRGKRPHYQGLTWRYLGTPRPDSKRKPPITGVM